MPIFTGTTDANGTLVVPLESTQMGGEIIKIKASKGMSIMEKEFVMPIPTYDPPPPTCGGDGDSNSGGGGNSDGGTGGETLTPSFVFDFPVTKEIHTALETNAANTFASSDKLEFVNDSWRGMVVRSKVQPTSEDAAAYVAFRFPKKEYIAQASPSLWYRTGLYDRRTDEPNYRSSSSLDKGYLTNPNYAFDEYSFDDDYFYLVFKNIYFHRISDRYQDNFIYEINYNYQKYVLKFDLGYID